MTSQGTSLDAPAREGRIRELILRKRALRSYYSEQYAKYVEVLKRSPKEGLVLELGSGAGFAKDVVSGLVTSDVIRYSGIDTVLDAARLPFPDASLRALFMNNVLHHLPDAPRALREITRCLKPSGRVVIVDQYPGFPARWIYRYLHHEPYRPESEAWEFSTQGPLSGANGALAWMIFFRDRLRFQREFPQLRIESIRLHSPLRYWLSGGLKSWTLLPGFLFGAATAFDRMLIAAAPGFASFMDVELVRTEVS